MLEVHTAGSRLVLGWFSARSRQNLGKILARSRRNFASAGDEVLRDPKQPQGSPKEAKACQKAAKGTPKAAKGTQKGRQREPKGAKREAKGSPRGAQRGPKNDKKSKLFFESVLDAKKGRAPKFFQLILVPFWEPKLEMFRVNFWLRFFIGF